MQVIECPHCFTRVIPKEDGQCPACHRDTRQAGVQQTELTSISVAQGDKLPPVCCDCGSPTDRYVAVYGKTSRRAGAMGSPPDEAVSLMLYGWFALILNPILRRLGATEYVKVEMPQCPACGKQGRPKPRYVDFDRVCMTFVVHRNLREKMDY